MEKLALTIDEAVKLGGPCRSALYEDIRAGRLRAVKRGRSTRILVEDFKKYLESFPALEPSETQESASDQEYQTEMATIGDSDECE